MALAGMLGLGFVPTRRSHWACNGLASGCTTDPYGPRVLNVRVRESSGNTVWNQETELPDGAESWDIDFSRAPGLGKSRTFETTSLTSGTRNITFRWAGDGTSSLMMLHASTSGGYSLENFLGKGQVGITPTANFPLPQYVERDWIGILSDLQNVDPASGELPLHQFAAEFGVNAFGQASQEPNTCWPWCEHPSGGFQVAVTPYFRLWDHGVCSIELPWEGGAAGGLPGMDTLLADNADLPRTGTVIASPHDSYYGALSYRATARVMNADVSVYPRLGAGNPVASDVMSGSFPMVSRTDDSVVLAGHVVLRIHGEIHFLDAFFGNHLSCSFTCDKQPSFLEDMTFRVQAGAAFPERVRVGTRQQERRWFSQGCDEGTCGFLGGIAEGYADDAKDEMFNEGMAQVRATAGWQINSVLTPLMPSPLEFRHWVWDHCPLFCNRRFVEDPITHQIGWADGGTDMRAWQEAMLHGGTPPLFSLQADQDSGPWEANAPSQFIDTEYPGCLGEDLRTVPEVCHGLRDEYITVIESLPQLEVTEPARQELLGFLHDLSPNDFECRPMTPGQSMNGIDDPLSLITCVDALGQDQEGDDSFCNKSLNDDRMYSLEHSPPTGMACHVVDTRPLPADAAKCAALEQICGEGPWSPGRSHCIDYFIFCGKTGEYCDYGPSSPVTMMCKDNVTDPRCLERDSYCETPKFCSSPLTQEYCDDHPPSDGDPPEPGDDPIPGGSAQRTQSEVVRSLCENRTSKCVCQTRGPSKIPDHRCGLRLPVERVNVTPAGFELVMQNGSSQWDPAPNYGVPPADPNPSLTHLRWARALMRLDQFMAANNPEQGRLNFCGDSRINWNRGGLLPRLVVAEPVSPF